LPTSVAGIDLYWLPLGAGGRSVRLNGRVFETVAARLERRPACDLYHSALEVRVPEGRFTIETAPITARTVRSAASSSEGTVGARWAGRFRVFRYEVRRWRDGRIPDVGEAVESPQRLSGDPARAQRLLDLVPAVPTPVWGRDETRRRRDVQLELGDLLADRTQPPGCRVDRAASTWARPGLGCWPGRGPAP
jgi:hypothetical protein